MFRDQTQIDSKIKEENLWIVSLFIINLTASIIYDNKTQF